MTTPVFASDDAPLPNDPNTLISLAKTYELLGVSQHGRGVDRMAHYGIPVAATVGKRTIFMRLGDVMRVVRAREKEVTRAQPLHVVPTTPAKTEADLKNLALARAAMITKFLAEDDNPLTVELRAINAKLDRLLAVWDPK